MRLRSSAVWLSAGAVAGAALAAGCLGAAFSDGTGGGTSSSASAAGTTGAGGVATSSSSHAGGGPSASSSSGAISCDGAKMPCGDTCVDGKVDADNCGTCGKKCLNTQVCAAGNCICRPGFTGCPLVNPTTCVDLQHDPKHCGSCTDSCPGDDLCVPGVGATTPTMCVNSTLGCPVGTTECDGGCYDNLNNAQLECGMCGTACSNLQACGGGKCENAYVATCATCTAQKLQCCQSSVSTINFCIAESDTCPGG